MPFSLWCVIIIYGFKEKLRKGGITATAVKYTIVSQLSSHTDSTVWLAEHNTLHVKRIIKGIRKTSLFHDCLVKEAHLLKNLKNPYIPEIYDLDEDDDYTYIIEEYIAGESLKSLCSKRLLSEKEIFHFIIQFCEIINYLHTLPKSLLYLDIKPENIIIAQDKCFLVDFGSSFEENTEQNFIFGTKHYASPEVLNGRKVTKSADVYALGRLLEYMLEHGAATAEHEKKLRVLVKKCTSHHLWKRFGSVKALMAGIKEIKKINSSFSEKPLKIAFAGAAPNLGTTYTALLFSAFIKDMGRKVIYMEMNDSEAWYYISPDSKELQALAGLEVVNRKTGEHREITDCDVISDYGTLIEEMPKGFYEADISCILVGNRSWETEEARACRALSEKCKKRLFLVNLTDDISEYLAEILETEVFMAIPYIKNSGEIRDNTEVKTVFLELAERTGVLKG